jgi:ABC-2 type transport system permease protein
VVIMSALSSNMWAGMGALEEIERGTLNRFLITPVSRSAIMNAGVAEQALTTTLQSLIIVGLAALGGAEFAGGTGGVLVLVVAAVLLGTVFSALSNTIGMLVRQRESIIGLSTMLLLPLTFLSPVFMPASLMPGWMQSLANANPVTWALKISREALGGSPDWASVALQGAMLTGLAVLMVALSIRTFRAYQKTV